MIKIEDSTRWFNALAFAEKTGQLPSLLKAVKTAFSCAGEGDDFVLTYDFAPHSFGFYVVNRGTHKTGLQGGIIYHGPLEDGSRLETLSIEVSSNDGWSVHT